MREGPVPRGGSGRGGIGLVRQNCPSPTERPTGRRGRPRASDLPRAPLDRPIQVKRAQRVPATPSPSRRPAARGRDRPHEPGGGPGRRPGGDTEQNNPPPPYMTGKERQSNTAGVPWGEGRRSLRLLRSAAPSPALLARREAGRSHSRHSLWRAACGRGRGRDSNPHPGAPQPSRQD